MESWYKMNIHTMMRTLASMFIPFDLQGTITYFKSISPSDKELEGLPYLAFTSSQEWDPRQSYYTDHLIIPNESIEPLVTGLILGQVSYVIGEPHLQRRMFSSVIVNNRENEVSTLCWNAGVQSKTQHNSITPEHVPRIWSFGLDTAQTTLRYTTHKSIYTVLYPLQ